MTKDEFEQEVNKVREVCKDFIDSGYLLSSKHGIRTIEDGFRYDANLKKKNINIEICITSNAYYSLTRHNSYTQARWVSYDKPTLFTAHDLLIASAYNFPLTQDF